VLSDFIFIFSPEKKGKLAVAYAPQLGNGNGNEKLVERWETFWAQEIDYYL